MLDAVTYPLNIAKARLALTQEVGGFTGTMANPRTTRTGLGSYKVDDSDNPVELLYILDNLYIEGFRNSGGQMFLHKFSTYHVAPAKRLDFGNDYKQLGYDRNASITVTLDNVNGALAAMYNATLTTKQDVLKSAFLYAAISFAEAVRFDDVVTSIIKGTEITDLDWTKHKDQGKVRVVQTAA